MDPHALPSSITDSAQQQPANTAADLFGEISKPKTQKQSRPYQILIVDHEPNVQKTLVDAIAAEKINVDCASTLQEARAKLESGPIDLILIEPNLPDGAGLDFAKEARAKRSVTQAIVITGQPSLERAMEAIHIGVAGFMVKPLNVDELNEQVQQAIARHKHRRRSRRKYAKLQKVCNQLSKAHNEVSKQVDVLCNDLVTAYQELAGQMQQVVQTSEFSTYIGDELDLEKLLRKTLEFLLEKAGPTNAALFLPTTADEFTVGGYVNYDCSSGPADIILQHLADVVAPRMAKRADLVHLTDDDAIETWIGDDAAYFADSHVIAFACRHEDEPLAVIVLFRDGSEPFSDETLDAATSIAPILGDYLAKVIRIHHRCPPKADAGYGDEGETPSFGF